MLRQPKKYSDKIYKNKNNNTLLDIIMRIL